MIELYRIIEVLKDQMHKYIIWIEFLKEASQMDAILLQLKNTSQRIWKSWGQLGLWSVAWILGFIAGVVNLTPKIKDFTKKHFSREYSILSVLK